MSVGQIAILIDGGYFLKRIRKELAPEHTSTPEQIAKTVRRLCFNHIARITGNRGKFWQQHLYRVFFYDAEPYTGVAHHPIANRQIEFAKSAVALEMQALFEQLRKVRKLALRLGKVNRDHDWTLAPRLTKVALKTRQQLAPLQNLATQLQQAADPSQPVQLQLSAEQAQQLLAAHDFWQNLQAGDVALGLRQKAWTCALPSTSPALPSKSKSAPSCLWRATATLCLPPNSPAAKAWNSSSTHFGNK